MALIVTGVGTLIHIYSIGYMHEDKSYARYFAYLNLFLFFMLLLVLGKSLLVLFVGWEGVGLASYLLIGFWFGDMEKAAAGKKAFIVNRIGDAGFLLGMFVIYAVPRHARHAEDQRGVHGRLRPGGVGEPRGHPPLHRRHREIGADPALRVAAGRDGGPDARLRAHPRGHDGDRGRVPRRAHVRRLPARPRGLRGHRGGRGAHRARGRHDRLAQDDIKKVLAYSTVSQLGFMFVALGVGAYGVAVFHVYTHAFFKACLFLGAGSVIHAMSGEQDIKKMGGLAKKIPITFATFAVATAAIAGVPPLAGFYSKDEILWFALASDKGGSVLLLAVMAFTALLTAFYMFRLLWLTFFGQAAHDRRKSSTTSTSRRCP